MTRETQSTTIYPNTLLVAIEAPYNKTKDINSYFEEFKNLAKSNGVETDHYISMKIREIDSATFLTSGKVEQITAYCKEHDIENVIISEPLTTKQERNLREIWDVREVVDRTKLILEIFQRSAVTAEGKMQVEIAILQVLKSKVAGRGVELSQQAGFIGARGPGETLKEKEMRYLDIQIDTLKAKLIKTHSIRETQRKKRLVNKIPNICLVGYTNAGKSTILNTLTKAGVLAEDKLFATLDTTTRELYINHQKKGVISDTVGFIQMLPTKLIEAFKSTLSELQYADLLLHVVDIADLNWDSQIKVVNNILQDLEVDTQMLYVFNKADKIEITYQIQEMMNRFQPNVTICGLTKEGIQPLVEFLDTWQPNLENKKIRDHQD
jgi:GTP-binding protein HflX